MNQKKSVILMVLVSACFLWLSSTATAQDDAVWRIKRSGKVTKVVGKISGVTPRSVKFEGRSGAEEIPVWEIEKIALAAESPEVKRAKDRVETRRFEEALDELAKAKATSPLAQAEIDFHRAVCQANLSVSGGQFTAAAAGKSMIDFANKYKTSHHFYPATDWSARMAMAAGKFSYAEGRYAALASSNWPKYVAKGYFFKGEAQTRQGKHQEAIQSFDRLLAIQANDDVTQQYKALAKVGKAKAAALAASSPAAVDASIKTIEGVIDAGDPKKTQLFAHAYNALGACYEKKKDGPRATESYLFTHMLFNKEIDLHAEAVFKLHQIWTAQKDTERAAECRSVLESRYRNSLWASRLN